MLEGDGTGPSFLVNSLQRTLFRYGPKILSLSGTVKLKQTLGLCVGSR